MSSECCAISETARFGTSEGDGLTGDGRSAVVGACAAAGMYQTYASMLLKTLLRRPLGLIRTRTLKPVQRP